MNDPKMDILHKTSKIEKSRARLEIKNRNTVFCKNLFLESYSRSNYTIFYYITREWEAKWYKQNNGFFGPKTFEKGLPYFL